MSVVFLILFPLVPAVLLAFVRGEASRAWIVRLSALVIGGGSIVAAVGHLGRPTLFTLDPHLVHQLDRAVLGGDVVLGAAMLALCVLRRTRQWWIPAVIAVQTGLVVWCELTRAPAVAAPLRVDDLALVMALIIGVVGSLICVYALPYMAEHQHHHDGPDRRRSFFAILFLFLSAMFAIVFANSLSWMFLAWEVTTLASFLLIGWTRTEEATRNAFRALGLNALGGLAFAGAIAWLALRPAVPTWALHEVLAMGPAALVPAVLIGVAGLAKAAQMPFSSWLLGAMVAPTPVSALLHSSTMVKAGVFVLVLFAPVYQGTLPGYLLALVGGVTFLATSIAAVTQSNAKRVLAYSTIANLGLIVMCAGVGSPQAVWAAIMLIVFHAVAKALLFLAVGSIEHRLGSRDIEDMTGLIVRLPALGMAVVVGILGMFLAPFGMLISKWACLEALANVPGYPPLLAILLAFGSAPTLFFWGKWLGKVLTVTEAPRGEPSPREERAVLWSLVALTVACSAAFPAVARGAVEPWLHHVYGGELHPLSFASQVIMALMLGAIILLPLVYALVGRNSGTPSTRYLAGANAGSGSRFTGALAEQQAGGANYYLDELVSERGVVRLATAVTAATLAALLLAVWR